MSGVDRVFEDKASGKDTDRVALQEMIAFVRTGDEVLVHSIDRLARDLRDLQSIITTLNEKGVRLSSYRSVWCSAGLKMTLLLNCNFK
jgi:DNA invertase Pin-like site-specific DNA recombinase